MQHVLFTEMGVTCDHRNITEGRPICLISGATLSAASHPTTTNQLSQDLIMESTRLWANSARRWKAPIFTEIGKGRRDDKLWGCGWLCVWIVRFALRRQGDVLFSSYLTQKRGLGIVMWKTRISFPCGKSVCGIAWPEGRGLLNSRGNLYEQITSSLWRDHNRSLIGAS